LSADFHQHATSQLMVQMLECHDRERFEVTLISGGPDDGSPMRRRIVAAAERFEDLRGQTQRAMAERIRALQVDILVDAKGATFDTLMRVTAHRPAPLQVGWLGFPGTSGAPFVDYLIGDRIVTPLTHAAHFSEKIAQMPLCYQPNDALRVKPGVARRADWQLPEDSLLLCAFHQPYKISPEVFDQWCSILERLPDAVLWLLRWNANVQARLVDEARARGIAQSRLLFAPLVPADQHLHRLACADLFLDAWPCNAHTTASEALWVGVPVVTVQGETFAQRVAASLLNAVQLPQLVCQQPAHYVETVVALARDPARRRDLREHLVGQRSSPLFDGRQFARHIEDLYERMWARAVAGLPPDHLPAA
jgi:predicted O-linked N-acetylglucosamine transferase (SPINDLY family)